MAKLTLTDIAAGYALITTFNANNGLVEAALENTLSRDGTAPNTMSAVLDMNSQFITNLPTPTADGHAASKAYVDTLTAAITAAAGTFNVAEAHNFTGQVDFINAGGIRVMDAGATDDMQISHDGTSITFEGTNTLNVDFTGSTGKMQLRDGLALWVYDSTDTDALSITHNGTDAIINGTTTTDLNVTGFECLKLSAGLSMLERAAAESAESLFGQLWVKDDTVQALNFTDESGVLSHVVSAAGSYTGTLTGCTTSPTATVNYRKVGNMVSLWLTAQLSGTSNATTMTITGMPAAIRPTNIKHCQGAAIDNGNAVQSRVLINTSGSLGFQIDDPYSASGFTGSGTKGTEAGWSAHYYLD